MIKTISNVNGELAFIANLSPKIYKDIQGCEDKRMVNIKFTMGNGEFTKATAQIKKIKRSVKNER